MADLVQALSEAAQESIDLARSSLWLTDDRGALCEADEIDVVDIEICACALGPGVSSLNGIGFRTVDQFAAFAATAAGRPFMVKHSEQRCGTIVAAHIEEVDDVFELRELVRIERRRFADTARAGRMKEFSVCLSIARDSRLECSACGAHTFDPDARHCLRHLSAAQILIDAPFMAETSWVEEAGLKSTRTFPLGHTRMISLRERSDLREQYIETHARRRREAAFFNGRDPGEFYAAMMERLAASAPMSPTATET